MEQKKNMIDKNKLRDVVICKPSDSVLEVSRILRDTRKRHILVADENNKPLGLISAFDINNRVVAEEKNPKDIKAEDMMSSPVETIDVNEEFGDACQKMVELETYTLPVTEDGKLIGILDLNSICSSVNNQKSSEGNENE